MARKHRIQIYLDPALSAALDQMARQSGVSKARLLRLAVRRFLVEDQPDPILGLIGIGDSGTGDTSIQHDRILAQYTRPR